jgi:tetratricopeptide (TPR) repeat protein
LPTVNTLGRYHIIREIARSNDIVYEAMDPARGKKIALKELQLPPNLVGEARRERIERFTREAKAAAGLNHPGVVRIHEYGQVGERYFIAMEFLEGHSLRDLLRARGSLPAAEVLRIGAAAADALAYAHQHHVVHRDVKPDNIHLEPDGRVVLTDFGIARISFEPTLTAAGQIFGTPSYMSPEQIAGKTIDPRSDIFSLGVMLFEMVSGQKPFTGDSVITITYNIMNREAPPLAGAPPGLEQVVRRAMAKDPARRYASAAQLAEDLRLISQGAAPRHASMSPASGGSAGWSSGPPRPASAPPSRVSAPTRTPPPVPPVGRARPYGQNGSGAAGSLPGPLPGPRPGARPMGRPPGRGQPVGLPPGLPGPLAPAAAMAAPAPVYAGPSMPSRIAPRDGGMDWKWFLGWLGLAVVLGFLVLGIVWSAVTASDRFRSIHSANVAEGARSAADDAFNGGKYQAAFEQYMSAVKSSSGARQETAKRSAAAAAAKWAEAELDASHFDKAEQIARQALQLNADNPSAYVNLGRAVAGQKRTDEALAAFDSAVEAAARTASSNAPPNEVAAARQAGNAGVLWKAQVLYDDGKAQMGKDNELARKRFQAVINTAPNTQFAQNAQIQLQQLGGPPDPNATPGDPTGSSTPGSGAPDGWRNDYSITP